MVIVTFLIGWRFAQGKAIDFLCRIIQKNGGEKVKKRLVAFLFVGVMAMSFVVPAMANTAVVLEPVSTTSTQTSEIAPFSEQTQIHFRACGCCLRLQFRVWGVTSGKWLTDWQYL